LRGASADEITKAWPARRILALTPLLDRYPRNCPADNASASRWDGHRARPASVSFDEPLSNLDAKLRVAMRTEIKELHQRLKTTTVYVTHDQIEAMTMADKIVVMHDASWNRSARPLEL